MRQELMGDQAMTYESDKPKFKFKREDARS